MARSAKALLKTAGRYVGVYMAWIVSAAFGVYALLKSWEAITQTYRVLFPHSWGYGAVHNFSIVILGIAWLIAILYIEDYYRTAAAIGHLPKRFLRVTLIEAAIAAVALAVLVFVA
mgnify:CR=1 FL=1